MTTSPNIKLTIQFNDPELEPAQMDEQAQLLLDELRDIPEIITVDRVIDLSPPIDSKAGGGFLVGLLTAELNINNVKKIFQFLRDRLGGKQIEMTVKLGDDKEISIKASSREEFDYAIESALKILFRE
jgi:hypothetical protein